MNVRRGLTVDTGSLALYLRIRDTTLPCNFASSFFSATGTPLENALEYGVNALSISDLTTVKKLFIREDDRVHCAAEASIHSKDDAAREVPCAVLKGYDLSGCASVYHHEVHAYATEWTERRRQGGLLYTPYFAVAIRINRTVCNERVILSLDSCDDRHCVFVMMSPFLKLALVGYSVGA